MPFKETFDPILERIINRLVDELNSRVSDSFFDCVPSVNDFPNDWNDIDSSNRIGLVSPFREENYFTQERRFFITLRIGVSVNPDDKLNLIRFADEIKRHFNDLGFVPAIWSGFSFPEVRFDVPGTPGFLHAEIWPELIWVRDRPIVLNGVKLEQTILAQSVEDATITKTDFGPSSTTLTEANLKDRDPATTGWSGTVETTGSHIDIVFPSAVEVDYILLGHLTSNVAGLGIGLWYGSSPTQWKLISASLVPILTNNLYYIPLRSITDTNFRISFDPNVSTVFSLKYIFMGSRYDFAKSYDIRDTSIGLDVEVSAGVDDPKGFKFGLQSAGVRKEIWEVTWGLRKAWFDDLVTQILFAQIDQKNFLFRDIYRDTDFHLVKLRDEHLRVNQYQQDYLRVNLRMDEQ